VNISFFGSSLVSAYGSGAATYYCGLLSALHRLGHTITFFEPDADGRHHHHDTCDPPWARVVVYPATQTAMQQVLEAARTADVIVKASGVGVFDRELEAAVLDRPVGTTAVFWDIDASATLDRLAADPADAFHALLPQYDAVLTYGGGERVVKAYSAAGARVCVPIYHALDPLTHFRVERDERFACDLAFLGNWRGDRESRVDTFFLNVARSLPAKHFIIGGRGWDHKTLPANTRNVGYVCPTDHNAFNSTPLAVLNVSCDMARYGPSPAARVFEAAGAAACVIADWWDGIEAFLEPTAEILTVRAGFDVVEHLRHLTPASARAIGERARQRVLASHTYAHRAALVSNLLRGRAVAA